MRVRPLVFKGIFVILLFLDCLVLSATEKHWIAHEAQAIIVGKFQPSPTWLWFDGWRLGGTITVDEALYGGHVPDRIHLRLMCTWANHCPWWPPPHYPPFTFQKGL
jgi:hypothetical protein